MTPDVVVSKQGITFTSESVDVMRNWATVSRRDNQMVILWSVTFDDKGGLAIGLAADHEAQPGTIPDQVDDVVFYWYTDQTCLDALRKYCIDKGWERKSRLIPISAINS